MYNIRDFEYEIIMLIKVIDPNKNITQIFKMYYNNNLVINKN